MRLAAIEGGGTTWVIAISIDSPDNIIEREVIITDSNPVITLTTIKHWLLQRLPFDAIGIASFGPIDAKKSSPKYGYITSTPKPGWKDTNVVKLLGLYDELSNIPFLFDTDVNAPALAEYSLKRTNEISSSVYITVGTGVGVGLVINGKTVHGLVHPEGGHILVKQQPGDSFTGNCPFHQSCLEGLVGSTALALRKGIPASGLSNLSDDDPIWDTCAYYLAQLCVNVILISSPERIVIGGGIMNRESLYVKIRAYTQQLLQGYIQHPSVLTDDINEYIGPSLWGNDAGIVGAAYLAKLAYSTNNN